MTDARADSLADRYGRPSRGRRTAIVVGCGLVGVLALAWLAWTTLFHANPDVRSHLVGWEVVDDHSVVATVDVTLGGDAQELDVSCAVRAFAEDHTVVGALDYPPQDGRNEVLVRTERRATSVESVGCTTSDQRRPR